MATVIQEVPAIDEALWNAWLLRHKVREQKNARRAKLFAGLAVIVAAIGGTLFSLR